MRRLFFLLSIFLLSARATYAFTVYVTNSEDTVGLIDSNSNTFLGEIPVANISSVQSKIAITPDGTKAYVTNFINSAVTPINLGNNTSGTPILVGDSPTDSAITPDGATVYVVNAGSDDVTPIDVATDTAGAAISVGDDPLGIAITPDGTTAFVTNSGDNTITPIDIATNTAGAAIPVPVTNPTPIAITPDGTTAYIAGRTSDNVVPFDIGTSTFGALIPVGSFPQNMAITPDGSTVYVANRLGNTITPITVATNTAGTEIPVGSSRPFQIAITPDGKFAYIGDNIGNLISVLDTSTNSIVDTISFVGGFDTSGVAISPFGPNIIGKCVEDNYLTQTDLVNVVSWNDLNTTSFVRFLIFRNIEFSDLAGTVAGSQLFFEDHQKDSSSISSYFLIGENSEGGQAFLGTTTVVCP